MPSVAEATVSAPRSQHSCFAALAKNSHPRTVFTALRAAASRRSIPTVTSFPQNDKLQERVRRLIRISIIKTKRTPVPPCHCERSVAISRKGNVGNAPAPAKCPRWLTAEKSPTVETETIEHENPEYSPAQALRREILCVIKTLPLEHEYTEYSPAVAHCLARSGSLPCPQRLTAFRSLFYHKTN